ncbi:NADH dehydrogenase [ubiquinone] 1 alpha subcomplex subunit 2-like [Varroa jacobsoni]|uniref:NADH dehydrogenase [ubiquinone] 1 alpha subcomplex subunit 2 n=1 Tax=Varroa destructor TaxID=109461 RepID=A0A7M7MA46_VARDE|nr:NADH dehydrogenase [ubiquinone] 1 alpha subcomplex subunit 2-like [Varroa destructor]XP_022647119.1 NADH dehydrogenase [ubiquinone] 1 alpha subcomplex subunit 2-like [Varroa destructor]XP_022647120.1 NADH dehydrogenase [ubiquinone] 1 alpha subcomplex subunit 2-like [Varroa destructor]XP_022710353.1 NADH dehydrogenase [ubiquinone] 1 alpha subcomplex subunit 2-like [Varroa jacobsoni]
MSRALKLVAPLRELRVHLCQTGKDSQGVRDFVEKFYVPLKENNPKFPILIRECSGVQPKVYARYAAGRETHVSVSRLNADQVMSAIEKLATNPL